MISAAVRLHRSMSRTFTVTVCPKARAPLSCLARAQWLLHLGAGTQETFRPDNPECCGLVFRPALPGKGAVRLRTHAPFFFKLHRCRAKNVLSPSESNVVASCDKRP
jgi:hypothetical protein